MKILEGYETHIIQLKDWVINSDRLIDNQKLLQLKTDCSNNNHKDMYKELIELIDDKLGRDTKQH